MVANMQGKIMGHISIEMGLVGLQSVQQFQISIMYHMMQNCSDSFQGMY